MLKITLPAQERYDEKANEFIKAKEISLTLEHSLVSISKWESKWHKSFLSKGPEGVDETIDYIRCMTLTQNVDPMAYLRVDADILRKVFEYIDSPMTATTINRKQTRPSREIITAEVVYYWMISLGIPMECQKWHLNRLLTLIEVCSIKNGPQKKMSKKEAMAQQRALNAARRKKH